jgi:hypothetical protein
MNSKRAPGEPGWSWRRAIIFPVVAFACWRLAVLEGAADTSVNETIAWGWIMLVAALVLGYSGIAAAQDIAAIITTKSGRPYAPDPVPAPLENPELPPEQRAG